jgi:diguanylate cyclase (GGDEF)-like protein
MARGLEYASVERKVLHGLLWSLSAIFALALITFAVTNEQHESSRLVAKTERALASISEIGELAIDAESAALSYLLSGNDETMRRYSGLLPSIDSQLDNFRELSAENPQQLRLADDIQRQIHKKFAYLSELVALRRSEGLDKLLRTVGNRGIRGNAGGDIVRATLYDMEIEERKVLDKRLLAQGTLIQAVWAVIALMVIIGCTIVALSYRQTQRALSLRREAEERAEHLAHHDGLTGLPNRRLLEDRLLQAIAFARRRDQRMAVLFIDLDGFKAVNDSLGHDGGDQLLKEAASRLLAATRAGDSVARLGGDEFVVSLTQLAQAGDAGRVAAKLIEALAAPYEIKGEIARVTASIGLALYPEHGSDDETLIKAADAALYIAKTSGKNAYRIAAGQVPADADGFPAFSTKNEVA